MRNPFVKALGLLREKRLCVFAGLGAVALFLTGTKFFTDFLGRTDLIPFLDTLEKNTIVFAVIALLFLVALGEFTANCGRFSFASYIVTTFFAALSCYVIISPLDILMGVDLSDASYVADMINASYGFWWKVFLAVFLCSLICGLIINRKHIFTKKLRNDAAV